MQNFNNSQSHIQIDMETAPVFVGKKYRAKAENGDAVAQLYLAECYRDGK